ncbi:phycobilisome linker polypeptide CpcG2 [Rivularia sp. IAM M-261]|nr:phycobilisome linker polypeptide CpcG2 [Calothrix sp. PCC 7716]GJD23452.1 phycobilisome linker polypeptide CpcG2 [Rivularia sp. IAM M-261]
MSLPLLTYSPSSQNQRVSGYEIPGDEQPRIFTTDNLLTASDMDTLILAAYRQIFNEQQMLAYNRQTFLESQLKAGQITVRDFIRGLAISDTFKRRNYDSNSNYRFVQMCIQRILGREVYNEREKLAWSTVLATKGLKGFIDDLLSSQEYLTNFGYNMVPFQRRRILPHHSSGELPFARMARYDKHYRETQPSGHIYRFYDTVKPFNLATFLREADFRALGGVVAIFVAVIVLTLLIGYGLDPVR